MFGGRYNHAAGRANVKASFNNCYTNPIRDDSVYGWLEYQGQRAKTYAKGGGEGGDISIMRPYKGPIRGSVMGAPGAVSFMDASSIITSTIAQDGRRGASIETISVSHPDVHLFVGVKDDGWMDFINKMAEMDPVTSDKFNRRFGDRRKVSTANISVVLTKEFMNAVRNDTDFDYRFPDIENAALETDPMLLSQYYDKYCHYARVFDGIPEEWTNSQVYTYVVKKNPEPTIYDTRWDGSLPKWEAAGYPVKIYRTEKARLLWDRIIDSAHRSGEPGVVYEEFVLSGWTSPAEFLTTNPCGEITLSAYEPCCLGHINFMAHTKLELRAPGDWDATFDEESYIKAIHMGVRMQDLVHDANAGRQALVKQELLAQHYRRLGVGLLGWAGCLIMLKIRYDSPEANALADRLMEIKLNEEVRASALLAEEKGACQGFDLGVFQASDTWARLRPDVRDLVVHFGCRNIAVSTIAPTGTVTPFSGASGSGLEPIFRAELERRVKREDGNYDSIFLWEPVFHLLYGANPADFRDSFPDFICDSTNIDLNARVILQGTFQRYTTNSISSTVNLPGDISKEAVERIYWLAYEQKLKGITVYRDGSRAGVLIPVDNKELPLVRPRSMAAKITKCVADDREWYVGVGLYKGFPYEVFATTNDTDRDVPVSEAGVLMLSLAARRKVPPVAIANQLYKAGHQTHLERLCRLISMSLRHGVDVTSILEVLQSSPGYNVTSVVWHIAKCLVEAVPEGTESGQCIQCGGGPVVYESGCASCKACGHSKCG